MTEKINPSTKQSTVLAYATFIHFYTSFSSGDSQGAAALGGLEILQFSATSDRSAGSTRRDQARLLSLLE